ncbi:MAG: hypothetical protein OXT49_03925 [Gammaproteobacteria bacterium]|nr:hypothetical protein [Gammaproteobacteria bacterium]
MQRNARHFAALALTTLLATGCATQDRNNVSSALTAPLNDLNLIQVEIPPILQDALAAPYALPELVSCDNLAQRVIDLNAVLGPDVDADDEAEQGWLTKGTEKAKGAAVDAIHNTTTGVIPFRGWVRKLSGAERHTKTVNAAINAGSLQRAYYKGAATARGCTAPEQ